MDAPQGAANRHHYEYWTDIDPKTKVYRAVPMPRKIFVEMVMDRIAACKFTTAAPTRTPMPLNYLVHAEEVRDGSMMHPDTRRELLYVLTMLRDRGEKRRRSASCARSCWPGSRLPFLCSDKNAGIISFFCPQADPVGS